MPVLIFLNQKGEQCDEFLFRKNNFFAAGQLFQRLNIKLVLLFVPDHFRLRLRKQFPVAKSLIRSFLPFSFHFANGQVTNTPSCK